MNQQRSRRFRTAQEAKEKAASEEAAWEELTRMYISCSRSGAPAKHSGFLVVDVVARPNLISFFFL
jgi:hypothetical protein